MTRFLFLVVVLFVPGASVVAQDNSEQLIVNVSTPNPQHGTVAPLKLFLKGRELQVLSVQRPPDVPLDVVFVLDNGGHQLRMMTLAQNYVVMLASGIRESQIKFTVLLAAKEPLVLEETSKASELKSRLAQNNTAQPSSNDDAGDLAGGVTEAVHILKESRGVRVIVVVSDEDDNISGKDLQELKEQVVSAHILCYSILLAEHDFFGTKARSAWGVRLHQLSDFSGGEQYQTDWQNRKADPKPLSIVAERISDEGLVTFKLPADLHIKSGLYTSNAQFEWRFAQYPNKPIRCHTLGPWNPRARWNVVCHNPEDCSRLGVWPASEGTDNGFSGPRLVSSGNFQTCDQGPTVAVIWFGQLGEVEAL